MRHLAITVLLSAAACGEPAPGTIEVRVYGEEFIEERIPADVFVDGWSVTFDRFRLSIGGVTAQAGHDAEELQAPAFTSVDLAQPSGGAGFMVATFTDAPGGTYDHFGYVVEDVQVAGTATRDGQTVTFDWSFALTAVHAHCEVAEDLDGNTVVIQATIHGDHLFYDDLVAAEPDVAFDLIARADGAGGTPADGVVTAAELAAVDITGETRYQVGSFDVSDLWGFISHQVGTVGHVNGEGHCAEVQVSGL